MDNKVLPTRKVSIPADQIIPNQMAPPNPGQRGMGAPAVPPGHGASGMNDTGNGDGAYMRD